MRARSVSDWIGFVFYSVLAGTTLAKIPAMGVLLMPTLALELFAAVSFMIREPARASDRTGRARLTAYGGTLFVLVFLLFANAYYPYWLRPTESSVGRTAGAMLWMAGSLWAAYSVWYLRFAFSIEPEARRLISRGPYGIARHPVYLGYFGQYLGVWLLFPTVHLAAGLLAWFLLMADRMRNEERVLACAFPEYEQYRRRVPALGLGLAQSHPLIVSGESRDDRPVSHPSERALQPAVPQPQKPLATQPCATQVSLPWS